jgi:phage repressor protein C with HTH and peptisase S24 domain
MEMRGIDQSSLARRLGVTQGAISKILLGRTANSRLVPRIAVQLGVPLPWLLGETDRAELTLTGSASADDETVEITQLDLSFSMGPGTTLDDYIEETKVRFDLSYIQSFTRTPPSRLHLAKGVGESMFPTLVSSDLVWIDTTQTMLNQQDRIWAISLFGAAAIKRLRAMKGGKVLVMSDNATVENQEVDAEDLVIGGRVIRFARDL